MTTTSVPISIARTTLIYWFKDLTHDTSSGNLMLGSSTVRRLESTKYLSCGDWTNRGIGSSTVQDIETYLKYSQSDLVPNNILIYGGENDLHKLENKDSAFPNYIRLLNNLNVQFPEAKIHIVAIKPSMRRKMNWGHFMTLNSRLKSYSESQEHIFFHEPAWLEIFETEMDREQNPWLLDDGVHLTDAGYQAFAKPVNASCSDV